MKTATSELAEKIKALPDVDKVKLVDSILLQLDKPDPEIDRIWADEARKRWQVSRPRYLVPVQSQVMETTIVSILLLPYF